MVRFLYYIFFHKKTFNLIAIVIISYIYFSVSFLLMIWGLNYVFDEKYIDTRKR